MYLKVTVTLIHSDKRRKKALKTSLCPIIIIPRSDLGLCLDFRDDSRLLTGATSPGSSRSAHLTLISDLGRSGLGDGDFRLRTTLAVGSCGVYNLHKYLQVQPISM